MPFDFKDRVWARSSAVTTGVAVLAIYLMGVFVKCMHRAYFSAFSAQCASFFKKIQLRLKRKRFGIMTPQTF